MYLLVFYVPSPYLEEVKTALFAKGAGNLGLYDQSCWECPGRGQFRPLVGSHPLQGQLEELVEVEQYRVEMVVDETHIDEVINELKKVHPYEQPAYLYWKVKSFAE